MSAPPTRRTYGKRSKELSPPRPLPASGAVEEGAPPDSKKTRLEGALLSSTLASQGRMRAQLEEFSYQLVRAA